MIGARLSAALALGAILAVGCGGDGTGPSGPAVVSISLSFPGSTLSMGATQPLTAKYFDQFGNEITATDSISWSSSNVAIASVDQSGNVRGVSLGGPVTITVARKGKSAAVSLTVVPDHVVFTPSVSTLVLNSTVQLSGAPVDYFNAPIPGGAGSVTWSTSNPAIATVDTSGFVTGQAVGDVVISAMVAGRVGSLHIEVGVPGVYDGTWTGVVTPTALLAPTTYAITITVVFDRIATYRMVANPVTGPCGTFTPSILATPAAHIEAGQFAFALDAHVSNSVGAAAATVSGSFTSPTTMTGSQTAIGFGSTTCAGVGQINSGTGAGPLTATKQ